MWLKLGTCLQPRVCPEPSRGMLLISDVSSCTGGHPSALRFTLQHRMPTLPALGHFKKQMSKLGKRIMKSYRVQIPKYDMPIRLRPVRVSQVFPCYHSVQLHIFIVSNFPVVLGLHMHYYGPPCISWLYELFESPAAK